MRYLTLFGVLAGLLVSFSSCLKPVTDPSAKMGSSSSEKTDSFVPEPREVELPVGVNVGKGGFDRKEMGRIGEFGKGLIRIDWNNDGKDELLLLSGESYIGNTQVASVDPKLIPAELFTFSEGLVNAPTAADMDGDSLPELCTGCDWGEVPVIYSHTGTKLFAYEPYKYGVDEAMLADLKKDHHALVIAGCNGYGGLQAANAKGKTVFHDKRDLGNVWNVEAADLDGDGKLELINSSGYGGLTIWSSDLKYIRTVKISDYISAFAAVDHNGDGKSEFLLRSGRLIDGEGNEIWAGDDSDGMPFPSYAATADLSSSPGLETAWAQDGYNNFKIFAQSGDILYHEGLKGNVTGLISTKGLEGWEPGFLLQLEDGTLIHFGRKTK